MRFSLIALSIDFVEVLSSRGASDKLTTLCYDFESADRSLFARSLGQLCGNRFSRQIRFPNGIRCEGRRQRECPCPCTEVHLCADFAGSRRSPVFAGERYFMRHLKELDLRPESKEREP
jgi:hypothetical protein